MHYTTGKERAGITSQKLNSQILIHLLAFQGVCQVSGLTSWSYLHLSMASLDVSPSINKMAGCFQSSQQTL